MSSAALSAFLREVWLAARERLPATSAALDAERARALQVLMDLPDDSALRPPQKARADALRARCDADPFLREETRLWRRYRLAIDKEATK